MFSSRITHNIPFNEEAVMRIMYRPTEGSSFLKPEEINQKSSTGNDYSQKRPGVDYKSFGEKINF